MRYELTTDAGQKLVLVNKPAGVELQVQQDGVTAGLVLTTEHARHAGATLQMMGEDK